MKKQLIYCLLLLSLFHAVDVFSQATDVGISLGVLGSRYTVKDNSPPGSVIVRQGRVFPGVSIGLSSITGPSRNQPFYSPKLYSLLLVELNYSYNGGHLELLRTNERNNHFNDLKYVMQQLSFTAMYLGKVRNFRFMLGPSFNYNFKREVSFNNGEVSSAENQLNKYVLHGEIGIGWKIDRFLLSSRFNSSITDFSEEIPSIQTTYNAYQFRIVATYFIYQRRFEKNRKSIIWK